MSQVKVVVKQRSRQRWAAYGFLLLVALGVIAYFVAPLVITALKKNPDFSNATHTMTKVNLQLAVTAVITLVFGLIAAMIVTAAAPKKSINVKDKDLTKEREDGAKYHKMQKKRQRKLNREMREFVEKNQK